MILTLKQEQSILLSFLKKLGANSRETKAVTNVVSEADLRGKNSHGLLRFPTQVRRAINGLIKTNVKVKVVRTRPSVALVDGQRGFGQFVATEATRMAVRKAKRAGIAAVGIVNSNHIGMAGYYAELAAKEDMIGIVLTITEPLVHPFGGVEPIIGTNPIAIAIPTGRRLISLDMATSSGSIGKIMEAKVKGSTIPPEWALDADGRPTTDPDLALRGALSPVGGPKGYGLGLAIEVLAGGLVGASMGRNVAGTLDNTRTCTKGDLVIAIDIPSFSPRARFQRSVEDFVRDLKASRKASAKNEILLPGERGLLIKEERMKNGIPIEDSVIQELRDVAKELGLNLDEII